MAIKRLSTGLMLMIKAINAKAIANTRFFLISSLSCSSLMARPDEGKHIFIK